MIEELRESLDNMPFQQRLFLLALVSGHCAADNWERTMAALENVREQLQAQVTRQ